MNPKDKEWGFVAILDALGAATYSDREITRFVESREVILGLLNAKAEAILGEIKRECLATFTFNDTVLIIYRTQKQSTERDITRFFTLLRKFILDSLEHSVLFRGAMSIGSFYVNEDTNTVMGSAVTDAAAWYDRSEWIGIHATPHASIVIESLVAGDLTGPVAEFQVPLKQGPLNLRWSTGRAPFSLRQEHIPGKTVILDADSWLSLVTIRSLLARKASISTRSHSLIRWSVRLPPNRGGRTKLGPTRPLPPKRCRSLAYSSYHQCILPLPHEAARG